MERCVSYERVNQEGEQLCRVLVTDRAGRFLSSSGWRTDVDEAINWLRANYPELAFNEANVREFFGEPTVKDVFHLLDKIDEHTAVAIDRAQTAVDLFREQNEDLNANYYAGKAEAWTELLRLTKTLRAFYSSNVQTAESR